MAKKNIGHSLIITLLVQHVTKDGLTHSSEIQVCQKLAGLHVTYSCFYTRKKKGTKKIKLTIFLTETGSD